MIFDRSDKERMMFNLLISLVVLARSSNESDNKSRNGLKLWAANSALTRLRGFADFEGVRALFINALAESLHYIRWRERARRR
jgi:hypothetical protein